MDLFAKIDLYNMIPIIGNMTQYNIYGEEVATLSRNSTELAEHILQAFPETRTNSHLFKKRWLNGS